MVWLFEVIWVSLPLDKSLIIKELSVKLSLIWFFFMYAKFLPSGEIFGVESLFPSVTSELILVLAWSYNILNSNIFSLFLKR